MEVGDQVQQRHGGLHHVHKHGFYKLVHLLCIDLVNVLAYRH